MLLVRIFLFIRVMYTPRNLCTESTVLGKGKCQDKRVTENVLYDPRCLELSLFFMVSYAVAYTETFHMYSSVLLLLLYIWSESVLCA